MQDIMKKFQEFVQKNTLLKKIQQLMQKSATPATKAQASNSALALARSQFSAGQKATAVRTIESSLFQNPDQTESLKWWIALHQKKLEDTGMNREKAYYAVLKEANKRFNSLTVKSLLTQFCHKYGKKDLALEWYYQALALADATDPRLVATTTLLENAGWLSEGPDTMASFATSAEAVAPEVTPTPMPPTLNEIVNPSPALEWWGVDLPLWCYGWTESPTEIEPSQSESRIIFFQFTGKYAITTTHHAWTPEDLLGQISRAIPLYLLEKVYYHSAHSASVIFPVTTIGQFGFLPEKLDKSTIISVLGDRYPAAITGHFTQEKLELTHLNLKTQEETTRIITVQTSQMGLVISAIEQFLYEMCGIDPAESSSYASLGFSTLAPDTTDDYLSAVAQHVSLVTACYYPEVANNLYKPHRIIRHFLDLAFSVPALQTQLILLSAIQQNMTFHSEAVKDYQEPLLAWLSEQAVNPGPLHGLASSTWEKFAAYCGTPLEESENVSE